MHDCVLSSAVGNEIRHIYSLTMYTVIMIIISIIDIDVTMSTARYNYIATCTKYVLIISAAFSVSSNFLVMLIVSKLIIIIMSVHCNARTHFNMHACSY